MIDYQFKNANKSMTARSYQKLRQNNYHYQKEEVKSITKINQNQLKSKNEDQNYCYNFTDSDSSWKSKKERKKSCAQHWNGLSLYTELYMEVKCVIHVVRGVIKRRSPAPRSVEDDYSSRACIKRLNNLDQSDPHNRSKAPRSPRAADCQSTSEQRSPQMKAKEKQGEKKEAAPAKATDGLVLDLGRLLKPAEPEKTEEEKEGEENGGGEETGAFNLGIFSGMTQDALMDALDE